MWRSQIFKIANLTISVLFLLGMFGCNWIVAQQTISGQVLEAANGVPIPFANVYFPGTSYGVSADGNGLFEIEHQPNFSEKLAAGSIGYKEQVLQFSNKTATQLLFRLEPSSADLAEIVIQAKKKMPKDTAAITLFRRIVKKKPQNSIVGLDSYSFEEYEKTEFDIFNLKEGFVNKKLLKPFNFVYGYTDTTEAGTLYLPAVLREKVREFYFQNNPAKRKEILRGDRFSGVQDYYKWQLTDLIFEEIDLYQNVVVIQKKGLLSPFANGALASYKYFLTDSTQVDGEQYYKLEFVPRRKGDLGFTGHVWVHEKTAAIQKSDVYLIPQTNLNFVAALHLSQDFIRVDGRWFKRHEVLKVQLNLSQKEQHQNLRIVQTKNRKKILLNQAISPTKFQGDLVSMDDQAWSRKEDYWLQHRHLKLTRQEQGIFNMLDSVKSTKAYKRLFWLVHGGRTGFLRAGPIEFGRFYEFLSWNALEGNRFKFGLKNHKFILREKFHFNTYLAYGDKDKLWKYHVWAETHLRRKNFLWHTVGGHYRYDWSYDYVYNRWWSYDRFFQSLFRNYPLDNLFLFREGNLYYEKEFVKGLINRFAATHKTVYSWPGAYEFLDESGAPLVAGKDHFETIEFQLQVKWTVANKQKDTRQVGSPFQFARPYITADYSFSPKGVLGSDFYYHRLELGLAQKLNSGLGHTTLEVYTGKLFGTVPFPLLKIHTGNEGWGFNKWGYNMMNDFEYASDTWASLWLQHQFDGLLFNLIPGIRKLKLRSLISTRLVTGSLTDENSAFLQEAYGLRDIEGAYVEAGVGIENIGRAMRIDFLWRLTQRQLPDSRLFGVKVQFKPNF